MSNLKNNSVIHYLAARRYPTASPWVAHTTEDIRSCLSGRTMLSSMIAAARCIRIDLASAADAGVSIGHNEAAARLIRSY